MHFMKKSVQKVRQTHTLQTHAHFGKSVHESAPRWIYFSKHGTYQYVLNPIILLINLSCKFTISEYY
jgi:hypothetical protein